MVLSTAIPKAIEKVMAVEGRNLMPSNPIIPPAIIKGIMLGRIDIRARRNERNNKYNLLFDIIRVRSTFVDKIDMHRNVVAILHTVFKHLVTNIRKSVLEPSILNTSLISYMAEQPEHILESSTSVPDVVIGRLPQYVRILSQMECSGVTITNSKQLGELLKVTPAQIRKDLSYFGRFGKQGKGYSVPMLIDQLRQILGINKNWNVLLIGVGRLGRAILSYPGFTPDGFHIVAAADNDPEIIGQTIEGLVINAPGTISKLLKDHSIDIGIVAVPIQRTQSVIDELVKYGVKAILNYAPITPHVPSNVRIQNIDPVLSLQSMTYYLNRKALA